MKAATDTIPRPRRSLEAYAALAGRLTPRDRWILRMLHEHRVFTTPQLADLAWGSPITAAHRILTLRRLGVITRWRPYTDARSTPWHWTIDALGADVIAAEKGITTKELGYRRDSAEAIFGSSQLGHQLGVNGVFSGLARTTRALTRGTCKGSSSWTAAKPAPSARSSEDGLSEWWPEARCTKAWGHVVRPDGYGRWQENGRRVDFFLEYDTGTETLGKVASKAERYSELARSTGIVTPVLIVFPTARREANFRAARFPVPLVPLATTSEPNLTDLNSGDITGPAGPVWAPLDARGDRRLQLIDLAPPEQDHTNQATLTQIPTKDHVSSAWRTRPTEELP